jgi:hypothetical protein
MEEEISKSTSYFSLFSSPGNRRRMRIIIAIAMFSQWRSVFYPSTIHQHSYTCSGNGLVSYYINLVLEGVGVTGTETKAAINGGLQVGAYCSVLVFCAYVLFRSSTS